jgi:hypothetical protein
MGVPFTRPRSLRSGAGQNGWGSFASGLEACLASMYIALFPFFQYLRYNTFGVAKDGACYETKSSVITYCWLEHANSRRIYQEIETHENWIKED